MVRTTLIVRSLCWSGLVNSRAAHDISGFGAFLVSILGGRALAAPVEALVSTGPTVVAVLLTGWRCGGSARASGSELGVGHECCDEFRIYTGEFLGEGAVGGGQDRDGFTIMGGGGGQVGQGVDGVLLVDGIVGVVIGGASSGAASVTEFMMGNGEVAFEVVPSFVVGFLALPNLAVLDEHPSREDELKRVVDDLLGGVGHETGSSKVHTILDLSEHCFDWEVRIIRGFEDGIIVSQVGWRDSSVLSVQVVQDLAGRDVEIAKVLGLQRADEHVVDSSQQNVLEGLVGVGVLLERGSIFDECGADVVDHRPSGWGGDDGTLSRVDGRDEFHDR